MDLKRWTASYRARYPAIDRMLCFAQRMPQLALAIVLFGAGLLAAVAHVAALAGALFGAGAALLGTWITEFNNRRAALDEKSRRQIAARDYLSPELYRTIERVLYIHERAIPNFISASAEHEIKPNDLKEDFIPYWPVLYPSAPQFRDLSGEEAAALIAFYDSLHSLAQFVTDWWGREGQLPVNIFNMIMHRAAESLKLALVCVDKFELDRRYPAQASGTISSRIERSTSTAAKARDHHIARFEAKTTKTVPVNRG